MNYDHMAYTAGAINKLDELARKYYEKVDILALKMAMDEGRDLVTEKDIEKAAADLEIAKARIWGNEIQDLSAIKVITGSGCRSGFTCTNCNAKIVMDSTGSGKAGTNDGDTYYVLGPCTCLLPCPKCGNGGVRNIKYAEQEALQGLDKVSLKEIFKDS